MAETWTNELEWLLNLRVNLLENMKNKSAGFGMEISDEHREKGDVSNE